MSATTEPLKTTIEASLAEPTLCHAFLRVAAANADHVALSDFGSDTTLTYGQWATRAS
jgi:hypothetical protein